MSQLRNEVPFDIVGSEEKFMKYLNKKAFKAVIISTCIGFIFYYLLKWIGFVKLGIGLIIILDIITFILWTVRIPQEMNIGGGGLFLNEYILKIYLRNKQKTIYIKGLNDGAI